MSAISIAIEKAGGAVASAKACGVRRQAVDKWLAKGSLPRTDYTGETDYAQLLANAAAERGEHFEVTWLRENARPRAAGAPQALPAKKDAA